MSTDFEIITNEHIEPKYISRFLERKPKFIVESHVETGGNMVLMVSTKAGVLPVLTIDGPFAVETED